MITNRQHGRVLLWVTLGSTAILLAIIATATYIKLRNKPEISAHLGSAACRDCHQLEHADWLSSLHPKMMRRVSDPGVVVADLSPDHPSLAFHPSEAVWAIGSKWEQQFMGESAEGETLLPGAWLVGPGQWQTTGWDGWQIPVPLERCHGCHTVGLNVETGHFIEPGIGCESCHGPGEWHRDTGGYGEIHSSLDAQVCGQCHSRGRSVDGAYFFPVGYLPGARLADYFNEQLPDHIQNSSAWWGNGSERKRHQEYTAWKQGGHADSLKNLTERYDGRFGAVTPDCLLCHAGEAAVNRNPYKRFALDEVQYGITCSVCHNVHGRLDQPRLTCNACHTQGAYFHQPERNANHVPCPREANVHCIDCHMPLTAKNGGGFTLHSHRPGIVPPGDTLKLEAPNSCASGGCHSERETEWLQQAFEAHYRRKIDPQERDAASD